MQESLSQRLVRRFRELAQDPWDHAARALAHFLFLGTALYFYFAFYEPVPGNPYHAFRFLGVAITVWVTLVGAFDFAVAQAADSPPRLRGLNLVLLSGSVFLCLIAMVHHRSAFWYTLTVGMGIALYVVWDVFARGHFKGHSPRWYRYYRWLYWADLASLGTYLVFAIMPYLYPQPVRIPFLQRVPLLRWVFGQPDATLLTATQTETYLDVLIGAAIWFQIITFLGLRRFVRTDALSDGDGEVLAVRDGYERWAALYDGGNAVIHVERRHTESRLRELDIKDKIIVDLGCGTGVYTEKAVAAARKVICIDQSDAMLLKLREKVKHWPSKDKVEVRQTSALDLSAVKGNIDGVLCCLVVDHLQGEYLGMLHEVYSRLAAGGWLYVTDVNPYFEMLEEPYAKFLDEQGRQQRIRVYPHTVEEVIGFFQDAGFPTPSIREIRVSDQDASVWPELRRLVGFPLVFEYFATKT